MKIFLCITAVWLATDFCVVAKPAIISSKMLLWKSGVRKGANVFNRKVDIELIKAACKYKFGFVRLSPDKFESLHPDFLLGNSDNYGGLIGKDLKALKHVIDGFHDHHIPVVVTMQTLPGSRWKAHHNYSDDKRLWQSPHFQVQAVKFWRDLAKELKGHPGIIGYNILSEPHPERLFNTKNFDVYNVEQNKVQKLLFDFYSAVVSSVREVDLETPIILDSSAYANPNAFDKLEPINDPNVLYSFHMFEPFFYTNYRLNKRHYHYPGYIRSFDTNRLEYWDRDKLKEYVGSVKAFQEKYDIPDHGIIVGEFGADRRSIGLENYFRDLISIFNEYNWHFAVYSFREDTWDGMNYEVGNFKYLGHVGRDNGAVRNFSVGNEAFKLLVEEWSSQDHVPISVKDFKC